MDMEMELIMEQDLIDKRHTVKRTKAADQPRTSLVCYLINARSIVNKLAELTTFVGMHQPDLILITETWLNDDITDAEIKIPGYQLFRRDRKQKNGGGCLIYSKNYIRMSEENELTTEIEPNIQIIWVKIQIPENEFLLGVCYNSPRSTNEDIEKMNQSISLACKTDKNVVLCGDFNFPAINWNTLQSNMRGERFLQTTLNGFLRQHIEHPTRENNILDLVFASEGKTIDGIDVTSPLWSSDHSVVKFNIGLTTTPKIWKSEYLDYRRGNYARFSKYLTNIDWNRIFHNQTTNEMWQSFTAIIKKRVVAFIPINTRKEDSFKPVWLTKKIIKMSKLKLKKWKHFNHTKTPAAYREYKSVQNSVSKTVRAAKRKIESNLAKNIKSDPKLFYKYVKQKTRSKHEIGVLKNSEGKATESDEEIVELLNNRFSSMFTQECLLNIPTPNTSTITQPMGFDIDTIETQQIEALLNNINPEKSCGPDEIHPSLLHRLSEELSAPLSEIFKRSLKTGEVPEGWKMANVCPIFKKGAKDNPKNYRPISITSQICRVLEKIIKNEIMMHLTRNEIIKPTQHGFLQNRSCLTNLLTYIEGVSKSVDEGHNVQAVYLDFSKAFDKVPHRRLLKKVEASGICPTITKWIKNWLTGRKQRVVVRGTESRWRPVTSGVPQGSVLGPILFLIYINDLEENVSSKVLKFADDTKIYRSMQSHQDQLMLQQDINTITDWSQKWQMEFNKEKCHLLSIGRSQNSTPYTMESTVLSFSTAERDLGVVVQQNLDWSQHIGKAVKKANQVLGLISRSYEYKSIHNILPLYKSLVRPHLEYAVQVWRPYKQKDIDRIERIQKRATRMIKGLENDPYEIRLKKTGLISLEMRRLRADLIEVFKIMKGMEDVSQDMFFQPSTSKRTRGHSLKLQKKNHFDWTVENMHSASE